MDARTLALRFGEGVREPIRRRIAHAFQTFCGVYGFRGLSEGSEAQVRMVYGAPAVRPKELELTASYAPRLGAGRGAPPRPYPRAGLFLDGEASDFPCLHARSHGRSPDWLGEIFEWLGGEAEHLAEAADPVGRVPFAQTLHGLYGLDPEVPYPAVAMRGLNQDIAAVAGAGWPDRPTGPPGVGGVALVATHDLDFLPVSVLGSLSRAMKNAAIAGVTHRDPALVLQIMLTTLRGALRGRSPLDSLGLMEEGERQSGIRSASYVICAKHHRRDANYSLNDTSVRRALDRLAAAGMEIGVHGSYTSLEVPGRLADEYAALRAAGFRAAGGRQHWLRYRGSAWLAELVLGGAVYDCSVGYSDRIGFRAGACFPYTPWNFATEAGFPLLEIPLAVMDGALYTQFRHDFVQAEERTRRLFRRVASYGWGGVSLLWHNTAFGGAQLPRRLGELYWRLKEPTQVWMTGAGLIEAVRPRFELAGLARTN